MSSDIFCKQFIYMSAKGVINMIGKYQGNYSYNKIFINMIAPDQIGLYYMGRLNTDNSLGTLYVGRALGENVSIRSRLLDHFNNNEWADITNFGYVICNTPTEVENFEKLEILRLKFTKYNKRLG